MNFKNGKLYKNLKIVTFFIIVFLCIGIASKVTQRKESIKKHQNFLELSEQIDVLLLGSSHIRNAINPVQLYAEKGITSYNMSKSTAMIPESYWTLVNALDYCQPKCIVIDIWGLDKDYKHLDIMNGHEPQEEKDKLISYLHEAFDYLPLSKNKIAAVNDLISDPQIRKEFYWDFTLYHGRWSELKKEDFEILSGKVQKNELLGAISDSGHDAEIELYQPLNGNEILKEDTVSVQYLHKILDLCEEQGIKVVMTYLPVAISHEQDWMTLNTAKKISEERDVLFIEMLSHEEQTVVDYYTDFYDDFHVNSNGMRKITSYFGEILAKNPELGDHRNDADYEVWTEKVSLWQQEENARLLGEQNLYQKLGQIQNSGVNAIVFMPGGSSALQDVLVRRYIKQLTGTTVVDQAAAMTGPYLYIRDTTDIMNSEVRNIEFAGEVQPEPFSTFLGEVTYFGLNNFGAVYVDEDFENNYLNMDQHYFSELQILILNHEGEGLKHFVYDPTWNRMKNVE